MALAGEEIHRRAAAQHFGEGGMTFSQLRVKGDSALGGCGCLFETIAGDSALAQLRHRHSHQGPAACEARIKRYNFLADTHDQRFHALATRALELARQKKELIGFGARGAAVLDRLLLFGQQLELQRLDDRLGDLVLQREDVVEVAVVALGPDVAAGRAVDELRGDAHAVAGFAHAAFEHVS